MQVAKTGLTLARPARGISTGWWPVLRHWAGWFWGISAPLTVAGVISGALLLVAAVGLIVDPRAIGGVPGWLKPAKFAVAFVFYAFTLMWLLSYVEGKRRLVRLVGGAIGAVSLLEQGIIVFQVVRGRTSHFNVATPLDALLWALMGQAIVVLVVMTMVAAVALLLQRLPSSAFAWGVRLGLGVALLGMAVAVPMTMPSAEQLASLEAGRPAAAGGHSVGVADGGPGLPVVGWSTVGGDWRAPHFVGLHGLQVLPVVGWLIARWPRFPDARRKVALVWTVGLGYAGLTLLLAWQALRGQSIVQPNGLTLAVLAALVAVVGVLIVGIMGWSRGRRMVS